MDEEKYQESVDGELWELASMEYPGKNDGFDLEFDDEEEDVPDEPKLREWLKWVVMSLWLVALGFGVPAMNEADYNPKLPPGCYMIPDRKLLAYGRHSYFIQDSTTNLLISSVIINYILPGFFFIVCSVLLCTLR